MTNQSECLYSEVGSFEAKTRLAELLRAVEGGQRYTITLRGKPVADLVPSAGAHTLNASAAVEAMRAIRKVTGVSDAMVKDWIIEGRR